MHIKKIMQQNVFRAALQASNAYLEKLGKHLNFQFIFGA